MGAGVIPFSVDSGELRFLLRAPATGRKAGYLVDFGGKAEPGEQPRDTAVRGFVEQTATLYFEDGTGTGHPSRARRLAHIQLVDRLFEQTQVAHPTWWCRHAAGADAQARDWVTYFVEVPYRDLKPLNRALKRKRRRLRWVTADELLHYLRRKPKRLWKRVRRLQDAAAMVEEIRHTLPA